MYSGFRNLAAYRLASELSDELYEQVATWSAADRWAFGMQLTRAVDSVGANIAESSGRWHRGEKRQLLIVARGSLYEAEHWLARAVARGLLAEAYTARTGEIARALSGLIRRPGPS